MKVNEEREFKKNLESKTDSEMYDRCKRYIWLSAYAANNPRSDYHRMADLCYDECNRRGNLKIYSDAYRVTFRSECGYDPRPDDGEIRVYK